MKSNELRRGDYVMFFDKHKDKKLAKVDQIMKHSCLLLYDEIDIDSKKHSFKDEIEINYKNIKPVELTQDIISKITKLNNSEYFEINPTLHLKGNELYASMNSNKIKSMYSKLNFLSKESFCIKLCEIHYVHELQHILKDFKINKEISL